MIKLAHTILTNKTCKVCGKRLKANLINRKPNADLCYKHYRLSLGKTEKHTYPRLRSL